MFSNNALALDFYGVYVVVDGATYTYRCFSLNHAHALETATAATLQPAGCFLCRIRSRWLARVTIAIATVDAFPLLRLTASKPKIWA